MCLYGGGGGWVGGPFVTIENLSHDGGGGLGVRSLVGLQPAL